MGERSGTKSRSADLSYLLRLRLVVARVGELDLARWWNTRGQLGPMGTSVLRRGFPRTHRFAQARSVFAVAGRRCEELYSVPNSVTLWNLPAELEDDFNEAWATWIERAANWEPFFAELEVCSVDLAHELSRMELVDDGHLEQLSRLKRSIEQRAVPLPDGFTGSEDDFAMLALGFARGEEGSPAVPFQKWGRGE
jgi:hypothetical protein